MYSLLPTNENIPLKGIGFRWLFRPQPTTDNYDNVYYESMQFGLTNTKAD